MTKGKIASCWYFWAASYYVVTIFDIYIPQTTFIICHWWLARVYLSIMNEKSCWYFLLLNSSWVTFELQCNFFCTNSLLTCRYLYIIILIHLSVTISVHFLVYSVQNPLFSRLCTSYLKTLPCRLWLVIRCFNNIMVSQKFIACLII